MDALRYPRTAGTIDTGMSPNGMAPEERLSEERKRYTSQLQRRAQAHVTAELAGFAGDVEIDQQVTMVVQHALETTGALRVALYRPTPRGRRWHVTMVHDDGGFYYGQVAPETLGLPMTTFQRGKLVTIQAEDRIDAQAAGLREIGIRTYLGVPVKHASSVVGVVEVVDVNAPEHLARHAEAVGQAVALLGEHLGRDGSSSLSRSGPHEASGLSDTAILDLVLRPPIDIDATIQIAPGDWAILNQIDGERQLRQVAEAAGISVPQAAIIADQLIERGLVRHGRESRRRV